MGILRFVVWTAVCVSLGLFLGTYEWGGHTAWQAMQGAWKRQAPSLEKVKVEGEDLLESAKKKVTTDAEPKERHLKEDREAVEQIISKRSKG